MKKIISLILLVFMLSSCDNIKKIFKSRSKSVVKVEMSEGGSGSHKPLTDTLSFNIKESGDGSAKGEEPNLEVEVGSGMPDEMSNSLHDVHPKSTYLPRSPRVIRKPNIRTSTQHNQSISDSTYSKGFMSSMIPDTMWYGAPNIIELRIAKDKSTPGFDIDEPGTVTKEIRISRTMSAYIYDVDSAFTVRPMNNGSIQIIESEREYTSWQWIVIPTIKGNHELVIKVSIISEEGHREFIVGQNKVCVNIKGRDRVISVFEKIGWAKFSFILTTVIIPLIIFFYKRRRENERNT